MGEHDRCAGRVRAHGRGRDALAVLLSAARPEPPVRIRPGARDPAAAPDALELGHVPRPVRERRGLHAEYGDLGRGPGGELKPLDTWLLERTRALVREATAALRAVADGRRHPGLRGVRRRRLELVHPPLAPTLLGRRRDRAPRALACARPGAPRDRPRDAVPRRAPLAGARPAAVRRRAVERPPRRLAGELEPDDALLAEIDDVRRVVGLGHQARQAAGSRCSSHSGRSSSRGRARRPPRGRDPRRAPGQGVRFDSVDAELVVKPNLPVLGPRLGAELGEVRAALASGEFEDLGEGRFRVACTSSAPDEVLVERAGEGGLGRRRGGRRDRRARHARRRPARPRARVYELIRRVNPLRKDSGLRSPTGSP